MKKSKKIKWIEIARRGKAQPLLVVDVIIEAFRSGYFAKAHKIKWNVKNFRQFDSARWYGGQDLKKYRSILEKASRSKKVNLMTYAKEYERRTKYFYSFVDKYKNEDFTKYSNNQLADVFESWFNHTVFTWSFVYDYIFINQFLPDIVTSIVASHVPDVLEQNEYLGVLFQADKASDMRIEKKNLVNIARYIRDRKLSLTDKNVKKRVDKHLKKFAHLGFYYFRGKAYTKRDIKNRLREYLSLDKNEFQKILKDFAKQARNASDVIKIINKLELDKQTIKYIKYIKRWGALSNYCDETYGYVVYNIMSFWKEICKRLKIDYSLFYSLTAEETAGALRADKISFKLKKEAKIRHQNHAFILENGKRRILIGKSLKQYTKREKGTIRVIKNVKELKGCAASLGKEIGRVRLIFSVHDIKKVERGEILVASSTNPTYVPAMEKARAIITDEGGLLSHAAIVSRELGIPCVIGTKIATKALKDGDKVEVDANKGIVKKL